MNVALGTLILLNELLTLPRFRNQLKFILTKGALILGPIGKGYQFRKDIYLSKQINAFDIFFFKKICRFVPPIGL